MDAHPLIELEISCTDRQVDLLAEGFDCVLRVGAQPDHSVVRTRAVPHADDQLRERGLRATLRRARDLGRSGAASIGALRAAVGFTLGRFRVSARQQGAAHPHGRAGDGQQHGCVSRGVPGRFWHYSGAGRWAYATCWPAASWWPCCPTTRRRRWMCRCCTPASGICRCGCGCFMDWLAATLQAAVSSGAPTTAAGPGRRRGSSPGTLASPG